LNVSRHYIILCLNSYICLKQAHLVARGVAQKTVTLGDLTKFTIPLPPIMEQNRIADEVERVFSILGKLELLFEVNHKRTERLRQAVLQKAFVGKMA
jgi:type I restriction enzyme, S subunit